MSDLKDESFLSKNRIEALCDGIFAIAMTLMILDLKTPENIPFNLAKDELPKVLLNLLPSVEAYAISFLILGIFWMRHQIQFKYIQYTDRTILSINIIFLLFIGFVPFSVGIMMRYPDLFLSFIIYDLNLLIIALIMLWQWFYISKTKKILVEDVDDKMIRRFGLITLVPVTIFILSFLVSFISVRGALMLIYLDPLFFAIYRSVKKRK